MTEAFRAPDGTRIQYFENGILRQTAAGSVEPLPLGKIAAERAKLDMEPIEQPDDVPLYDEALFVPPPEATPVEDEGADWSFGPGPQQGAWREVVVSISAQTMWAYEEGEMVMSSLVSTGTAEVPETTTPVGYHSVLAKFDAQTMEGTISGEYYRVEDVPFVMYFDNNGNAIHGTYWHSNFGAPHEPRLYQPSHGHRGLRSTTGRRSGRRSPSSPDRDSVRRVPRTVDAPRGTVWARHAVSTSSRGVIRDSRVPRSQRHRSPAGVDAARSQGYDSVHELFGWRNVRFPKRRGDARRGGGAALARPRQGAL